MGIVSRGIDVPKPQDRREWSIEVTLRAENRTGGLRVPWVWGGRQEPIKQDCPGTRSCHAIDC